MKVTFIIENNAEDMQRAINALLAEDKRWRLVSVYPKADRVMAWLEWSAQ